MRPNIVLITSDQQRRNSLGVYGNRYVCTDNLDALAQKATVYDHCYCNAPVCTPSRACLLTGKTPMGHGVYNLFDVLPRNEKLLPWYLRELGYATAMVGKLHVSGVEYEAWQRNLLDGFDLYEMAHEPSIYLDSPFNGYARWLKEKYPDELEALRREGRKRKHRRAETHFSTWVSERSAQVIHERDKSKPLFLYASYFDPHNPYDHQPPEADALLDESNYPEPIADDVANMPEGLRLEAKYHCPKAIGADGEALKGMRRGYFAAVSFLDQQLGKIIQALKEEGIYDDTLIVYTSDHGDMLGDHGLYAKGAIFYEDGVNVPLIVKYPHQSQGLRCDDLVQLNDLFATLYEAAGGDAHAFWESVPLQGKAKRDYAVTEYRACGKFDLEGFPHPLHASMIRTQGWKLTMYHDTCEGQLFDLKNDPQECRNLYGIPQYRAQAMALMERYLQFCAERERRYNMSRGGLSAIPGFAFSHKADADKQ